jgi:hypothetical protein
MGWLDHSTNNIILDAVLTDYGRQRLATAGNAFNITSYALGDDEVDYRLVKKYGRTVGKEKIEKNTPIFEALTNQNVALKYRLISTETDGQTISSVYLPTLKLNGSTPALQKSDSSTVKLDLYYGKLTGAQFPGNFIQTSYSIKVSDRFFEISMANGGTGTLSAPDLARNLANAGDPNRTATYTLTLPKGSTTTQISFDVRARPIDNTTLTVYGKRTESSSVRTITSYITVIGERHGCSITIPVTYTASL